FVHGLDRLFRVGGDQFQHVRARGLPHNVQLVLEGELDALTTVGWLEACPWCPRNLLPQCEVRQPRPPTRLRLVEVVCELSQRVLLQDVALLLLRFYLALRPGVCTVVELSDWPSISVVELELIPGQRPHLHSVFD